MAIYLRRDLCKNNPLLSPLIKTIPETMNIESVLSNYHFPAEAKAVFREAGITELFPPQAAAIEAGVLDGKNLLMSVPTAAGKTLIAELCMLRSLLENKGRGLYIVPLKALASEKLEDFKKKYSGLGIKVGMATGDTTLPDNFLSGYHIIIATAEKVDSLLRSRAQWLLHNLNIVVLDEIHFLNDGERGPTLEILTARIRQLNPEVQLLALSATVGNARQIADWLNARLVESSWRPIPLREGVYFQQKITFLHGPGRLVPEELHDHLADVVLDTLRGKGQVLVFVNSRRSAQAASHHLTAGVTPVLSNMEKEKLRTIARQALGSPAEATHICRKLAEGLLCGVAFHHAGLKPGQRSLIEDNFKKNLIKVICSTPTLAAGVNLPARRVVLRDIKRYEGGLGSAFIPTSEYKQCAGRAGRPQYDKYGEAVIVAKSAAESKELFDRYIKSGPEPVESQLGNPATLRIHILASIAGGYVHDINDTFAFLALTFLAHQKKTKNLIETISEIFDFLQGEGFIEKRGFRFYATPFGQYTSRLYIDPLSAIILRDGLKKAAAGESFSSVGLLHLISACPDSPLLRVRQSETREIELFAEGCRDELILTSPELPYTTDFHLKLAILKTTMMLGRWVEEEREEPLCAAFNIGPGDVYRHVEAATWLLHAGITFAELFEYKKLTFLLANLKSRVRYGIKEELIGLTRLKGIGRIRSRKLYSHGFRQPADLKYATLEELAGIETIGKLLAQDLLRQVSGTHALLPAQP